MLKRCLALLCALLIVLPCLPAGADEHPNWYEVFVRSYQDSDGDGLGDLNGLTARLDALHDLGWNGLWLMPVMPSPSYHKYDVTNYMDIDPEYGTLEDMRTLIAAAHARGFLIILDLPVNHTSTRHPWFEAACDALRRGEESPYTDYYHFLDHPADGYVQLGGTGWYYEERFAGGGMPDLNLDSEAVRAEITAICDFWLREMDADGFRLDAVTSFYTGDSEANIAFLRWLKESCEAIRPGSYLVGECWSGLTTIADYYRSGVDSFFLFPASQAEGFVASSLRGRSKHAEKFNRGLLNTLEAIPDGLLAPFLSNHDTGRTIGSVQGRSNRPAAKFAEGLLGLLPGRTFTYYGEEIGMVGSGDDPNKRLAMYWNDGDMTQQPPGVTNLEYAYPCWDDQMADPDSLLHYCAAVNAMRSRWPMIPAGTHETLLAEGDLLLMRRTLGEDACLIAVNFSSSETLELTLPAACRMEEEIETGAETAVLDENGLALSLPPYSIVILTEK
ncbi:MAG: alpha-amylase [Clostridia bacterium]|nr:alpha-amylase [Clostridia bacterium]MBQ6245213.1 hypothetical protein [Bacteroidales bacterium]